MRLERAMPASRAALALVAVLTASCAGGGGQGNALMPGGNAGAGSFGATGNTVVRIYVPAGSLSNVSSAKAATTPAPPVPGALAGAVPNVQATATPPVTTPPPAAGSQAIAINVSGPTTISQTLSVGPNSEGCVPAPGGSMCQLSLSLPAGTYTGTVGSSAVAFNVSASANNVLGLTLGGLPSQVVVVPASSMSAQNAQGQIDLYGAGKHLLLVEMLDANQNVVIGSAGASFGLTQTGGSLSLAVAQASTIAPNLFYVSAAAASNSSSAILRATATYAGPTNPCVQSAGACTGTARVDVRQVLAVANSGANSVTLYASGQTAPLTTIQNGVTDPQALVFDAAGDLFVANQPGSVTEYVPPYNQSPIAIANGVNHPRSLAVDVRGNLFVANGSGSNTITIYSPPFGGAPAATISSKVSDPVSLALDSSANLFVVNAAANTVTEYAPPYSGAPTIISKGLNAPSSLALDVHGNLFVANLTSTPSSVVEYAPPFTDASAPIATITNGINEQGSIAALSSTIFVPNQGANTVTEYAAPYTGSPTTIVGGQSEPVALAIDAASNLYVANFGNNTVTEYSPPYAAGSWTTIATGVTAPLALALSPAAGNGAALLP